MTKKLNLILLIALLAVVSGCVKKQPKPEDKKPVEKATTTEPVHVATSTETMNNATSSESELTSTSTEGWLTYRNEEYGLELKYPPKWDLKENTHIYLGKEQNYVMISNAAEKSNLVIDKIGDGKIIINEKMNIKLLDNITIGGYTTEIAYIESGLNQDFFYRYFLRTPKENLQIYFVLGENSDTKKSIFYHIINTIKFD